MPKVKNSYQRKQYVDNS